MNIKLWQYTFKQGNNKIDTQALTNLTDASIDEYLNAGIISILREAYGRQDGVEGFEVTEKMISELETLVIKSPTTLQPPLTPDNLNITILPKVYEFRLSNLVFPHLALIRIGAKMRHREDNTCVKFVHSIQYTQHDDLAYMLDDELLKPSFQWERLLYTRGRSSDINDINGAIYVYVPEEAELVEIYPEYIKYPNEVSIGGYNDIDGNLKSTVESDLPQQMHREVIRRAIMIAAIDLQQPNTQLHLLNDKIN